MNQLENIIEAVIAKFKPELNTSLASVADEQHLAIV